MQSGNTFGSLQLGQPLEQAVRADIATDLRQRRQLDFAPMELPHAVASVPAGNSIGFDDAVAGLNAGCTDRHRSNADACNAAMLEDNATLVLGVIRQAIGGARHPPRAGGLRN
eukprot:SAG31_NODE_7193_length_1760_cov_1.558098_2_plen_113_part_00